MISTATHQATIVVTFLFTKAPINFLSLVKTINGIKAKAMPNDKMTWLMTSAQVGLTPDKMTASGGNIVMTRRT